MKLQDLHTHTYFCDGKDSPEEMVLSAIDKGLDTIGICTHAYTPFDEDVCIALDRVEEFQIELKRLKSLYQDRIEVLCGVEQDIFSTAPTVGYDYVIGSVHYFNINGEYIPIDLDAGILKKACEEHFNSDIYALIEHYYQLEATVCAKTHCDIIGHFDLITKFNVKAPLFDTKHPRYMKAWQKAMDELLKADKPFEINTGAISRGYRTSPYPENDIIAYIKAHGGKLIISSDGHQKETVAYRFEEFKSLL